jgi:hypothetical protein
VQEHVSQLMRQRGLCLYVYLVAGYRDSPVWPAGKAFPWRAVAAVHGESLTAGQVHQRLPGLG